MSKKFFLSLLTACAVISGSFVYDTFINPPKVVEVFYTVKPGDTLWTIAEEFHSKNTYDRVYFLSFLEGIRGDNPQLRKSQTLTPGQQIVIRYKVNP